MKLGSYIVMGMGHHVLEFDRGKFPYALGILLADLVIITLSCKECLVITSITMLAKSCCNKLVMYVGGTLKLSHLYKGQR